jgi:hypothetical protein
MLCYSLAKLCNLYDAYELSRRLKSGGRNITSNAFNPGMMNDTGYSAGVGPVMGFANKVIAPVFAYLGGRLGSSEKSGAALAQMITDAKYEGMSGIYIDRGKEVKSSELSYNLENAKELWETSERLIGGVSS